MTRYGLMFLLTWLSVGCVHLVAPAGDKWIKKTTRVNSEVMEKFETTTMTPEFDKVVLKASLDEDKLTIAATRQISCQHDIVERRANTEIVEYELPGWHWVIFGIGATFVGGGSYLVVDGSNRIDSGPPIGDSAEEKARDTGQYMFDAGLGVLSVGGLLLLSELGDALLTGNDLVALADSDVVMNSQTDVCEWAPVEDGYGVVVEAGEFRIDLRFESGETSSPLDTPTWSTFPIAATKLVLSCDQCEPTPVDVPSSATAAFAIKRDDLTAFDAWLAAHPATPETESVTAAREGLVQRLDEEGEALRRTIQEAEDYLGKGEYNKALYTVASCSENYPTCAEVRERIKAEQKAAAIETRKKVGLGMSAKKLHAKLKKEQFIKVDSGNSSGRKTRSYTMSIKDIYGAGNFFVEVLGLDKAPNELTLASNNSTRDVLLGGAELFVELACVAPCEPLFMNVWAQAAVQQGMKTAVESGGVLFGYSPPSNGVWGFVAFVATE